MKMEECLEKEFEKYILNEIFSLASKWLKSTENHVTTIMIFIHVPWKPNTIAISHETDCNYGKFKALTQQNLANLHVD